MKMHIIWFKDTGKWVAEDTVQLPHRHNNYFEREELMQLIVDLQTQLHDGWLICDYYVVIDGIYEDELERGFINRLFKPGDFVNMRRSGTRPNDPHVCDEWCQTCEERPRL